MVVLESQWKSCDGVAGCTECIDKCPKGMAIRELNRMRMDMAIWNWRTKTMQSFQAPGELIYVMIVMSVLLNVPMILI